MDRELSRRDVLRLGAAGTALAATAAVAGGRLLGPSRGASGASQALRAGAGTARGARPGGTGTIRDVDHLVVIIQENRSFDHYFGTRKGVPWFADPDVLALPDGQPVWHQPGGHPDGYTLPFHFDSRHAQGQCPSDPGHDWGVQHAMWNKGAMSSFVRFNGTGAMGYLDRSDLPWYHAVADAFTVCDMWFCSALAATNPNRYYSVTGTIDPTGAYGGPAYLNGGYWYTWETYPERLERAGVSWRMYHDVDDYDDNVLKYFRQYQDLPHTSELWQNAMRNRTVEEFEADVANGDLPQVSYIIAPAHLSEHPSWASVAGQEYVRTHVEALARSKAWEKTVVLWTFDENGGFFDHVPPPTPPPGTKDEFVNGTPIGLGYRVPSMVISPWSTGGKVVSDTFDHTSILRFCEARWGVEVPYVSAWRRATCGDLTSALDLHDFDPTFPAIPSTAARSEELAADCSGKEPNTPPATQAMPKVEA